MFHPRIETSFDNVNIKFRGLPRSRSVDRPQQLPHLKDPCCQGPRHGAIVQGSNVVLHGDSHDIHIKLLEQCRFLLRGITVNENLEPPSEKFQTKKPVGVATWLLTARRFSQGE